MKPCHAPGSFRGHLHFRLAGACNNGGMDDLGRRDQGSAGGRLVRRVGVSAGVLAVGMALWAAPVVGEGTNRVATPNDTLVVGTVAATQAQAASAGTLNGAVTAATRKTKKKQGSRQIYIESRITDSEEPIISEVNKGTFVGIQCPKGSIAVSGGVVTSYIDLLISSSSPNHPITGKYTPRKWWLTVTNANIDGNDAALAWRGVVNCMSPVKLKR